MTTSAEPTSMMFYTDRTAAETDDTCGMKFWLSRKEGVRGIVPKEEPLALLIGRETHEDLATIAAMTDISPGALAESVGAILDPLTDDMKADTPKMEVLYRRLGWLVAFALFIEPRIRARYANVQVEAEIILNRDPLFVGTTPDRILEDRSSRDLIYKEYKSTITAGKKWLDSWLYSIQMHIGLQAASEELGRDMAWGQVMGLHKGYYSAATHHLTHPYVWGYYNPSTREWTHDYARARSAAWIGMPIWEFPGGIVEWVTRCGQDVAEDQFPHTPPIFVNTRMLNDWVARRLVRERQVASVESLARTDLAARALHFPRIQKNCLPAFGDACPYLLACWNATWAANPSSCPQYEPRQPHHDVELVMEKESHV